MTNPTTPVQVERGNVIRNKQTGQKQVIRKDGVEVNWEVFEFVCDEPHADNDFSYICTNEYCRCYQ